METIYNWLLHNTGNEGNYLTILNVERHMENGEVADLEVMARTKNFAVINLLIKSSSLTDQPVNLPDKTLQEKYLFSDENQTIAYLSEGKAVEATSPLTGINVYVFTPIADAGKISFPTQ